MKRIITILILVLSVSSIFGQDLPKPINRLIKKLQKKGSDTILVYISVCSGCEIKGKAENCTCFDREGITNVYIIFKIKGETYKEEFSCCQESSLTKLKESLSIPYFLSLRDTLRKRDTYHEQAAKLGQFFPPIPTDNSYEGIELIVPGHKYEVSLSSYQINEGYKEWKKYFWIDSEIKLMDFVRNDVGIHVKHSSIPID